MSLPKLSTISKTDWGMIIAYGKHAANKAKSNNDDFAQHGCVRLTIEKKSDSEYYANVSAPEFGVSGDYVGETRVAAIEQAELGFRGLALLKWSTEL